MDRIIVTCAVTGAIHTPSMSPYLPITPEQIARSAVEAAEAGAAIVHIHVRNPKTGEPTSDPALFGQVLQEIKKRSDVIVNITTGGSITMTLEERLKAVSMFRPEMASLNMGSMNFGLYPMASKDREWKFEWEKKWLESTRDVIFKNTFADAAHFCRTMNENRVKPELECYDVGHVYNVKRHIDDGSITAPVHLQFVLGVVGGIGATPENFIHMKNTADNVIGSGNFTYSVCAGGKAQFPLCILSAALGGHVRVGLEDNLYLSKGKLAKTNGELVRKIIELVGDVTGKEPASSNETREILKLKGKSDTNF